MQLRLPIVSPPSQGAIIGSKLLQHVSLLVDYDTEPLGVHPEGEPAPSHVTADALFELRGQSALPDKVEYVTRFNAKTVGENCDVDRCTLVIN